MSLPDEGGGFVADEVGGSDNYSSFNIQYSLFIKMKTNIFPTFIFYYAFIVCSPVRWALTFVGCDKSKQKHAFAI